VQQPQYLCVLLSLSDSIKSCDSVRTSHHRFLKYLSICISQQSNIRSDFLDLQLNMAPEAYKISVPQEKIENLKTKLALAEFPDELSESAWDLGVPLADMKRLTKAWAQWDWRQAEERLNRELPQFHTSIEVEGFDPLDIHFVWQKSDVKNAIPLLFVHGCKYYLHSP
jgi:hypothetical protein